jgi:hypothetical protein
VFTSISSVKVTLMKELMPKLLKYSSDLPLVILEATLCLLVGADPSTDLIVAVVDICIVYNMIESW